MNSLKVGTRVLLLSAVLLACLTLLATLGLKSMRSSVAGANCRALIVKL